MFFRSLCHLIVVLEIAVPGAPRGCTCGETSVLDGITSAKRSACCRERLPRCCCSRVLNTERGAKSRFSLKRTRAPETDAVPSKVPGVEATCRKCDCRCAAAEFAVIAFRISPESGPLFLERRCDRIVEKRIRFRTSATFAIGRSTPSALERCVKLCRLLT